MSTVLASVPTPATATAADPTAPPAKPGRDKAFLLGMATIPLFMMGIGLSTLLAGSTYPSPFGDRDGILAWMAANQAATVVMAVTQILSALALLVFASNLAAVVRTKASDAMARLVSASGTLAAGFLVLSAMFTWVAARPEVLESPATVRLVHDLSFLAGGPANVIAFGVMAGTASLALVRTLSRGVAVLGMVAGAVSVLSVASLASETAAYLLPIGRFPAFAWLALTALALSRRAKA